MARYHLRHRNIKQATLDATTTFFRLRPWVGTDAEKQAKFEDWLLAVAAVYEVNVPELVIDPHEARTRGFCHGFYVDGLMVLPLYSVTTLFHEFRHHLQAQGRAMGRVNRGGRYRREALSWDEQDAVGWSCSLFYKVWPTRFRKMVRQGRIHHVYPQDLLRSRELPSALDDDSDTEETEPDPMADFESEMDAALEELTSDL